MNNKFRNLEKKLSPQVFLGYVLFSSTVWMVVINCVRLKR